MNDEQGIINNEFLQLPTSGFPLQTSHFERDWHVVHQIFLNKLHGTPRNDESFGLRTSVFPLRTSIRSVFYKNNLPPKVDLLHYSKFINHHSIFKKWNNE